MLYAPTMRRFNPLGFGILVAERTEFEPRILEAIQGRSHLWEVDLVNLAQMLPPGGSNRELTKETIHLPLGCLQGGDASLEGLGRPPSNHLDDAQRYLAHTTTPHPRIQQ